MANAKTTNPFLDHMGIQIVSWTDGESEFKMPIQDWHLNRRGALQGGVVSTLVDAACGYAGPAYALDYTYSLSRLYTRWSTQRTCVNLTKFSKTNQRA